MVTVLNVVEARVGTLAVRVNEYGEFWVNLYVCPSFGAWSGLEVNDAGWANCSTRFWPYVRCTRSRKVVW